MRETVPRGSRFHRGSRRILILAGVVTAVLGCAHNPPGLYGGAGVSPSPGVEWSPPPGSMPKPAPASQTSSLPSDLLSSIKNWTLADVVDVALRNSTQTRLAWAQARAAAAAYGSRRGSYLPQVTLGGTATTLKGSSQGGKSSFYQRSAGGTASLSWLLFDFGGREASIAETRQALISADWDHDAAIQSVILEVEQAYYRYVSTHALRDAQGANVQDEQANLDAAEERHKAGVGTIADVLQARTALSQSQLDLETLDGEIQTTRGGLATAMGLPANTAFDVELPPLEPPAERVLNEVDSYLDEAVAARPDLASARAQAEIARAHVRTVKAEGYPSLTATGNIGRTAYRDPNLTSDTYAATLGITFPLFTGFSHGYDVAQARAEVDAAQARLESTAQAVALEVWTSYYALKTADQRLRTSDDLLKSATESHDVAAGRYKAGVGSILDLLQAQAALENARAQVVQARADWFLALAQLAHDTGTLHKEDKP